MWPDRIIVNILDAETKLMSSVLFGKLSSHFSALWPLWCKILGYKTTDLSMLRCNDIWRIKLRKFVLIWCNVIHDVWKQNHSTISCTVRQMFRWICPNFSECLKFHWAGGHFNAGRQKTKTRTIPGSPKLGRRFFASGCHNREIL